MKKVTCILLSILLIIGCIHSFAETEEAGKDAYLKSLKIQSLTYQLIPDKFDDNNIMYTYLTFMLYMNSEMLDMFNLVYALNKNEQGTDIDLKKVALSSINIVQIITDAYQDWLNGKLTDKQYADVLMTMVNSVIEDK